MAFTNKCRFLYPLVVKSIPILVSGFGFSFSVSASEINNDTLRAETIEKWEQQDKTKIDSVPILPQKPPSPPLPTPVTQAKDTIVPQPRFIGGVALPILHTSSTEVRINTYALYKVLDKIGNRPFAIYSINGPARTGKSFLLNYFIRYLNSNGSSNWMSLTDDSSSTPHNDDDINNDDTISTNNSLFRRRIRPNEFVWRGETKRCTSGINIWSEPFEVTTTNGSKIPVLLLDCQGSFDDLSGNTQNAIIFAISTLLSSVLIFNTMKNIEEHVVQFLELFAEYAASVSASLEEANKSSQSNIFQKLIILIRDFDWSDYRLGLYTTTSTPEGETKNYRLDKLDPQAYQPPEVQKSRLNIISSFNDVSVYLMPEPGRRLRREDRTDALEPDFAQHLQSFVETTLNPDNLVTKRINGLEVTGIEFKEYVEVWAKLDWSRSPQIASILSSNQEVHYQLAKKEALHMYKIIMKQMRESEYKLNEVELKVAHARAIHESGLIYKKKFKIGGSSRDDERFKIEFGLESEQLYDDIKLINKGKPDDTFLMSLVTKTALIFSALGPIAYKLIGWIFW